MRQRALALSVVMLLTCVAPAGAQAVADTNQRAVTADSQSGWLLGASVGVPGSQLGPMLELFTVGIHGTHVRAPGQIGFDYSIGSMPSLLAEGVLVLGVRAGVALPLALSPRALLLPSTGVSAIGGASGGGGGALAGLNAGISGVAFGASGTGMRAGITWHRFQDSRAAVWLVEFGVVGLRGRSSRHQCECKRSP
jgi:hypothetical protein